MDLLLSMAFADVVFMSIIFELYLFLYCPEDANHRGATQGQTSDLVD